MRKGFTKKKAPPPPSLPHPNANDFPAVWEQRQQKHLKTHRENVYLNVSFCIFLYLFHILEQIQRKKHKSDTFH